MRKRKKTSKHRLQSNATEGSSNNRITKRNLKGETKLHIACIAGNIKRVTKLLDLNHQTDVRDHCGWTPLHEAANRGYVEIADLLIKSGANVNDSGGPKCNGVTPLHDAASCGHFSMMLLLIENGADFRAKTKTGETILDCLESWKERSEDLSEDEQVEYNNMLSKLSEALRQSAKKSPFSGRENTPIDVRNNDRAPTGDYAPENISAGEDYLRTINNVKHCSRSNNTGTEMFPLVTEKIQSALFVSREMIDHGLNDDRDHTTKEDNLVDERSFLSNNKRKSVDDTPKNDKIVKRSRTTVAMDSENNDLPPLIHELKSEIMETDYLAPSNDHNRENKGLEASALNDKIFHVAEIHQFNETEENDKKLGAVDVAVVKDTANSENESECATIGDDICLKDLSDVEAETRKREESSKRKTTKRSSSNYDLITNANGETELHVACIAGNIEEVTKLLLLNHPTDARDYGGWTPLHGAANHGHVKIADILIKSGAAVNDPGGPMCGGVTPLHVAASHRHFSMMSSLIKRGADLRAKTRNGDTILDCFEARKSRSEDLSPRDQVVYDNLLMELSAALPQSATEPPLSGQGNLFGNLTIEDETLTEVPAPGIISADENHRRTTENVKYRLRPNRRKTRDESSKHHSKHNTSKHSSNNDDTKRNAKGETKLHVACITGNIERVRKLLKSNHPTDVQDYYGWTPLQEAANHGHVEIAKLLIQSGAKVDDPGGLNCRGITPLHDAASWGHFSMMSLLIKKGANIQAQTEDGETVLDCLQAWKNRSKDLSPSKQVKYNHLHSRLSTVSRQSAEESLPSAKNHYSRGDKTPLKI